MSDDEIYIDAADDFDIYRDVTPAPNYSIISLIALLIISGIFLFAM